MLSVTVATTIAMVVMMVVMGRHLGRGIPLALLAKDIGCSAAKEGGAEGCHRTDDGKGQPHHAVGGENGVDTRLRGGDKERGGRPL